MLSAFLQTRSESQRIDIFDDNGASHPVLVPVSALRLLINILSETGKGCAVCVTPIHADLTTQEAAGLLSISRPVPSAVAGAR